VANVRAAWAAWLALALGACTRVGPSTAPLSAGAASEPPPPVAAAAPAAGEKPKAEAKTVGKGKRALYQRSCDLGSAIGCNDLAILLTQDPAQAQALLERSCQLGLARGCANLAVRLLLAEGARTQLPRALELLGKACDESDDFACAQLGDALYSVAREQLGDAALGRAHTAYERACKLGRMDACSSQGWMARNGEGTTRDAGRARELFRLACDQQSYSGCAALGYDLMDDAKNGEERAEGARWLELACEHDEAFGCFSLGAALLGSGETKNVPGGLALLKRSCALGSQQGCKFAAAVEERLQQGPAPAADQSAQD
jgi:TPR repeat protein